MQREEIIEGLSMFGSLLKERNEELENVLKKTEMHNKWFTPFHLDLSISAFSENYLNPEKLHEWLKAYPFHEQKNKIIGLIPAGNIPFVGMHDLLCVLLSGMKVKIKLSSKDMFFFPWMHQKLTELDQRFAARIEFVERLKDFDAVIATGSNNSARYFEYYFGKYPHIIRKNRTSVAILNGAETEEELSLLGKDVFYYYGLGCRNVSKLYVPENFDVRTLFPLWESFSYIADNNKYRNNFDYNRSLLLLNQTPHYANDFFMLMETEKLFSPLSVIHYSYYKNNDELRSTINIIQDQIQCIVGNAEGNIPFGASQFPALNDYADHIDTMQWLQSL